MRIIGGKYGGRILHPGKNFKARPTTDQAKEGLFNILSNRIHFENTTVLDLFSGTGSISFEFSSRNCKHVTLVESDPVHFRFILRSIEMLGIDNITPVRTDVFRFIRTNKIPFDVIFADPPYAMKELITLPEIILTSGLINAEGIFILEHPRNISFLTHPNLMEIRKYGNVHFSFFNLK